MSVVSFHRGTLASIHTSLKPLEPPEVPDRGSIISELPGVGKHPKAKGIRSCKKTLV